MSILLHKALFEPTLSTDPAHEKHISKKAGDLLFNFFKECPLFRWEEKNNNCENRANAICILLDKWNIPNSKGWVFSGSFLKKEKGNLINYWKYHVAALIKVREGDRDEYYIVDPSTLEKLETIQNWSNNITDTEHNYYFITDGDVYIYHPV
ncbi:MAG TPA: protein-glutamine glutaminase family protein, partial [Flavisolibacter sp.]|nr:protein-glutamine glutaminase family protein [Flavisolibacter sp.]